SPGYDPVDLLTYRRPAKADFEAQLDLINAYSELRVDRSAEILNQTGYPEHFHGVIAGLHPVRTKYTLELMQVAQLFATGIAQRVKHSLACKRPDMYSAQIQPMIPMPGHGALPSGHATEAATVARVLALLIDDVDDGVGCFQDQIIHQAERIAVNRTIAGVHFPADSTCGAMTGLALAEYFVARAGGLGGPKTKTKKRKVASAAFDGVGIGTADFFMSELFSGGARVDAAAGMTLGADVEVPKAAESAPLKWLWEKAKSEWPDRRGSDM
ncbi:MAG: phosphatase PAP2 family protein, partial [Pseudomonadota bacterium]